MIWANEIAAVLALPILLLSLIGFFPHAWARRRELLTPSRRFDRGLLMAVVVIGLDVKGIARMTYWDIWIPAYRAWRGLPNGGALEGSLVNGGINVLAALLGVLCLRVLWLTIPEEKKPLYSIWTAALYSIWPNGRKK